MPNIFGFPTPQELEQQRFAEAVQLYSNAAPGVALGVSAGQSASRLVGGLLGVKDVEAERAERAQALAEDLMRDGVSPGTPEGIQEAVRRAKQRGLFDVAAALEQNSNKIQQDYLKTQELEADVRLKRLQATEQEQLIAEQGQLTGIDKILSTLGKLPNATTASRNAQGIAATTLEELGIENPTLAMVAAAGRNVQAAIEAQTKSTTNTPTFGGGSVSTTTADLPINERVRAVLSALNGMPGFSVDVAGVSRPSEAAQPGQGLGGGVIGSGERSSRGVAPVRTTRKRPPQDLDLDVATEIGQKAGGKVTISATMTPDQIMQNTGASAKVVEEQQKVAKVQLGAINKLVRGNNRIASILEEYGAAHSTLISGWMEQVKNTAAISPTWTSDAIGLLANIGLALGREFGDPEEKLVVSKLNQAVTDLVLIEKERQNLGALTGPDVAILNRTIANPVSYLFRQTGPRGYFDLASGFLDSALAGAQESVNEAGLRGQTMEAPHPWFRLASKRSEVDDIAGKVQAGDITPEQGARSMSERLGFKVTVAGALMLAGAGQYAPRGGMVQSVTPNGVENVTPRDIYNSGRILWDKFNPKSMEDRILDKVQKLGGN